MRDYAIEAMERYFEREAYERVMRPEDREPLTAVLDGLFASPFDLVFAPLRTAQQNESPAQQARRAQGVSMIRLGERPEESS